MTLKLIKLEYSLLRLLDIKPETPKEIFMKKQLLKLKRYYERKGFETLFVPNLEIETLDIEKDKIYIFNVDVGDMPPHKANAFLDDVKNRFSGFTKIINKINSEVIFFAKAGIGRGSQMSAIEKNPNYFYKFDLDVGNMGEEKVKAFIKQVEKLLKPLGIDFIIFPKRYNMDTQIEILTTE